MRLDPLEIQRQLQRAGKDIITADRLPRVKDAPGQTLFNLDSGATPGNTGPGTSNSDPSSPPPPSPPLPSPCSIGGEDTFSAGMYCVWSDAEEWHGRFEFWKETADATKEGTAVVDFGGDLLTVHRTGARPGKGVLYQWSIEFDGIKLLLRNDPLGAADAPNVLVQIGSVPLMERGLDSCWETALFLVDSFGMSVKRTVVSRVDGCVDLVGVSVADFVERFRARQFVTRARKSVDYGVHANGLKPTGFTVGSGIVLRVYDKVTEAQRDPVKLEVMRTRRWGGTLPEHATRVEFQIRREDLKELGINTVDDWKQKRGEVLEYLAGQWFRMTADDVDRSNTTRSKVWSVWQMVVDAFRCWTQNPKGHKATRRKILGRLDLWQRKLSWFGALTSQAALEGLDTKDQSEFAGFILEQLDQVMSKVKDWPSRLFKKRTAITSAMGIT